MVKTGINVLATAHIAAMVDENPCCLPLVTVGASLHDWLENRGKGRKTTEKLVKYKVPTACLVTIAMPTVTQLVTYGQVRKAGAILSHRISVVQTLVATLIGKLPVSARTWSNGEPNKMLPCISTPLLNSNPS